MTVAVGSARIISKFSLCGIFYKRSKRVDSDRNLLISELENSDVDQYSIADLDFEHSKHAIMTYLMLPYVVLWH